MRKISADYIFPISVEPIKNGVVILNDKGIVEDVLDPLQNDSHLEDVETYRGIVCPGFINTHCHLELSHLKGKIQPGTGLDNFIKEIQQFRNQPEDVILQAIADADAEMQSNGIVAVGDISNGLSTLKHKASAKIKYHTFVELFAFHPDSAEAVFSKGQELYRQFKEINDHVSITPHSPYSVSGKLLKIIGEFAEENKSILTIHNQETEDENHLFIHKTGKVLDRLHGFGIDTSFFEKTGQTSLISSLNNMPAQCKIQFVHNTFTTKADIEWARQYSNNLYWCFCAKANLYIENRTPDFKWFFNEKNTIGTDSLASNTTLSVLDELKAIYKAEPGLPLGTLLKWATLNGAEYLGFDKQFGSIDKGKCPGILLIENTGTDYTLQEQSNIRVLA